MPDLRSLPRTLLIRGHPDVVPTEGVNHLKDWIPVFTGIQRDAVNKQPAVYILATKRNGTFYVGVTSDLVERIGEPKINMVEGFPKQYMIKELVWYESKFPPFCKLKSEKVFP